MALSVTFLGTGSSSGIPVIGCNCSVCTSADPRNKRMRTSLCIRHDGCVTVIDTSPEFRFQMLNNNITRLDALIYTHAHADHIMGLADIRPFNYRQGQPTPLYASSATLDRIRESFSFIFEVPEEFKQYYPQVELHEILGPFNVNGLSYRPLPVLHGRMPVLGFRFENTAYITDANHFPEDIYKLLEGLDLLILEAFGRHEHVSHLSLDQAVSIAGRIGARQTLLTHISHSLDHSGTNAKLPENIALAYDGLTVVPGETAAHPHA